MKQEHNKIQQQHENAKKNLELWGYNFSLIENLKRNREKAKEHKKLYEIRGRRQNEFNLKKEELKDLQSKQSKKKKCCGN